MCHNNWTNESVVTFVECLFIEFTHEEVRAEYVSRNVWGRSERSSSPSTTSENRSGNTTTMSG